MITEEIWKDIPGYEGLYQASNLGRFRSLPRKGTIAEAYKFLGVSKHSSGISQALKTNKTAYGFTWQEV